MSLNKVTLIGSVGKDPDIRKTQDGKLIASFSLATSESWKDKSSGERKQNTEWHRIVIFGQLAEIVEKYVKKGSKLYLEGSLKTREWTDKKDGVKKYTTEIVLQGFSSTLLMLDSKKSDIDKSFEKVENAFDSQENEMDDEIPF
jgi:single-strand DNA-binding protein